MTNVNKQLNWAKLADYWPFPFLTASPIYGHFNGFFAQSDGGHEMMEDFDDDFPLGA